MEYELVKGEGPEILVMRVNAKIAERWRPIGGPVHQFRWYQAIVREFSDG